MRCRKLYIKICIFNDFFVRDNIVVKGLKRPYAVNHMMPVVFLQAEGRIIKGQSAETRACRKLTYILDVSDGIIMQVENAQVWHACPKCSRWDSLDLTKERTHHACLV